MSMPPPCPVTWRRRGMPGWTRAAGRYLEAPPHPPAPKTVWGGTWLPEQDLRPGTGIDSHPRPESGR